MHDLVSLIVQAQARDLAAEYFARADQWTPRGSVLRCAVSDDGPDNQAVIYIDDQELSLEEFGRLLTIYAG